MTPKKRTLGPTGFPLSEIGFGAWAVGGNWGQDVDHSTAIETIHTALDEGVNFIDTADVYGAGRSESLVGEALKSRKERVYVATKMGRGPNWNESYLAMEAAVTDSLRRLGLDTLDYIQLHCVPFTTLQDPSVFDNLEKLREKGLIQFYGASVETVEEGLYCIQNTGVAALQVIFNIFRQKLIDELFPTAQEKNIGLIARVPLASGLLTGKFTRSDRFHRDDHRNFNADGAHFNVGETFAGIPFETGVDLAGKVEEILGSKTRGTVGQKALRWILDHEAITTVIPGAKTPEQATENTHTCRLDPLDPEIHAQLRELYNNEIAHAIRGAY